MKPSKQPHGDRAGPQRRRTQVCIFQSVP
nr:unnamed protein product [Callosobruchus chinensis]